MVTLPSGTYGRAELGSDQPGSQRIDPDVARGQFRSQGAGEAQESCLADIIRAQTLKETSGKELGGRLS